ncbi:MAG TPA: hypothetical protein VLR26_17605 [Frankiaceae bacterium]|nr:hypothetical protein [Frankiaceae bacterium]
MTWPTIPGKESEGNGADGSSAAAAKPTMTAGTVADLERTALESGPRVELDNSHPLTQPDGRRLR